MGIADQSCSDFPCREPMTEARCGPLDQVIAAQSKERHHAYHPDGNGVAAFGEEKLLPYIETVGDGTKPGKGAPAEWTGQERAGVED